MEEKQCDHPLNRVKKKTTGYWCLKCGQKLKHLHFLACQHGKKLGVCDVCRKSQKVIGDFLKIETNEVQTNGNV